MSVLQSTAAPADGKLQRRIPSLPTIKPDRLKTAKTLVEKAVKLRKVFSVHGPYPVIRAALWARGWVERRLPPPVQRTPHCLGDEEEDRDDGDVCADVSDGVDGGEKEETLDDMYNLMSRLVRNETTYFYWTTRRDYIDCHSLDNDQVTNHYANSAALTTKVGLCLNLRNLRWFDAADPDTFFPRCYRLGAEDEKHSFKEDFRRTACTSLLQHVVETSKWKQDRAEDMNDSHQQFVAPGIIDLAVHVCQDFLSVLEHSDIDVTVETPPSVEEGQWAKFMEDYYKVVHEGALIRGSSAFVERCQAMLIRLQEVCPQLNTDGLNNIWIIKPGAMSRGRGIMCMNRLDEILALVDSDRVPKESKWVVQKYLERPLLVHGTKFDLRQWFLVTDWNPLTVWFYRECYLRFSTQPYSTKSLDSSVHLCNYSIQKHFQLSSDRHLEVPNDNMWSCSQFKAFLQQQGRGAEWESVVVPGMQQAVVRALQTTQDLVEPRKAAVEVPHYVGVNLLVEGAPIRRSTSKPPFKIQSSFDQSSSEGVKTAHNTSTQRSTKISAFLHSDKENQTVGDKKRQLTSTFLKRGDKGKTGGQITSCVRRFCRSLTVEQPLLVHIEPRRKTRRLGLKLGPKGATLVPRSLSFSLSHPHSMLACQSQPNPGQRLHISRSCLPQSTAGPQLKTSARVFPPLQGPLPTLDILSLRPNIVAKTIPCCQANLSLNPSIHMKQLFPCSGKQIPAKCKGAVSVGYKH
ncbi:tubulin monoglycylase TTLL3 isoform X3 [Notolabrus celidotus]|uniref:tubulin monoglycylase TTLL3 isoform X3 n=1 Tax=Notolabrus celidotus TaxID=1203425 RepID=UPI0014907E79|nr:tubulin monoglycylase TTLL3 isoform X3 [Notolabrus celidotus]